MSSNKSKDSASIALKPSAEIVVKRKTSCQVHLHTYSVSAPKRISTQSLIACRANGGIVSSNIHVLQKSHYAEACTIVSQFSHAGIGTHIHSFLAQLKWHKNSVPNLAMPSGAIFLPFLLTAPSAILIAYERPPAAPDPSSSTTLSAFGNFYAHAIGFQVALVHHSEYGVCHMSTLAEFTIQASSSISYLLVNYDVKSAPSRVPCLALLGGEISPPHLLLFLDATNS